MKELATMAITVCASALVCSLVSGFVSDSGTKKLVNLIMGAFIVCSMIVPVKNAAAQFNSNIINSEELEEQSASGDEAYSNKVISLAKQNLEKTLNDLLEQNGIKSNKCEIILSVKQDNSIIISSVCIYINKEQAQYSDLIGELTLQSFGIQPSVITE